MSNKTAAEDPKWVYIAFGLVETACVIIGAPGSAIILSYFILKLKSKDRSASTFLYIWISLVDFIICLLNFVSAISDFNLGEAVLFENTYFCNITGFLWNISKCMSVFMIAVLSIARTVSITFPFLKVTRIHVAIPVIIYLLILVIQSSLPFVFITDLGTGSYIYNNEFCIFYIDQVFEYKTVPYQIFYNWVTFGTILLPFCIILTSCCVTVYQLRAAESEIRNAEGEKTKREATITIVMLTGIYIAFNTLPCFLWIIILPWMPKDGGEWVEKIFGDNNLIYVKLLTFTSIGLNSLFNVVVYFCRLKGLRQHVRDMIRSTKELLQRNQRDASEPSL